MNDASEQLHVAIVGLGRAGRARQKSIADRTDTTVAHTVSRRADCGTTTLEDALLDSAVDAVLICTENSSHWTLTEQCLASRKHVLVEYPLANESCQAEALFDMARSADCVLHVEFIGLLTARHRAMKRVLETSGCRRMELSFTGGYYGWVATEVRAGHWGQLALARLHALDDWFGELEFRGAQLNQTSEGYGLEVQLEADGVPIVLVEERGIDRSRGRVLSGEFANGEPLVEPRSSEPGQLFDQDFERFRGRVLGTHGSSYVSEAQVLRNLRLAEAINSAIGDEGQ